MKNEKPKTAALQKVSQEVAAFANTIPQNIATAEEYAAGSEMVVRINRELKRRKDWFQQFLAPAKATKDAAVAALKEQEAIRDQTLQPLLLADTQLRQALLAWKRQEDDRIRKEQERQNKLFEQRRANAEAKGKDVDAVKPPLVVAGPASSTKVGGGSFGVRKRKVLVIVDTEQIPERFFDRVRNDKRIEQALRAGLDVPGALLKEELVSAVRTA